MIESKFEYVRIGIIGPNISSCITEIHDIYHIDRGYDNLDGKLAHLGAKMWREEVED